VLALAFNDLATSEAVGGQFHAALGHYQDAERWDPRTKGLYRNLGLAAYRVQNFSEAIRGLSKEVAANPEDASARAVLGSVYFSADDYRNAVKTISPLGERAMHDPVVGYAWAASLMHLGDFPQASKILTEVEKLSLTPDTLLLVGKLWVELEDYSRAVSVFERVLAMDPKQPKVHYSAGLAYLRWQRLPEAIAQFNAQLQLTPGDADTINGLGLVYLEQGKREEAGGLFRAVVETHPENGNAQYQFGKLLLDDGNVKDAVTHLELAAKAMPESDYVHYQLQAAYRKDARIEDADRELELYKELKARNRQASIPRPSPNIQ
jgi:tetratricopeptide (TPR) repeat protein